MDVVGPPPGPWCTVEKPKFGLNSFRTGGSINGLSSLAPLAPIVSFRNGLDPVVLAAKRERRGGTEDAVDAFEPEFVAVGPFAAIDVVNMNPTMRLNLSWQCDGYSCACLLAPANARLCGGPDVGLKAKVNK